MSLPSKSCKTIKSGLMLLCLSLLLTGCAHRIVVPNLLSDCAVPYLADGPATHGDIVRLAEEREYAIHACNADKAALRAWVKAHPKLKVDPD